MRSLEFDSIRDRVVNSSPNDTWQEDELHFFVFLLRPEEPAGSENGTDAKTESPMAVFVMHHESGEPVSAVVVTPLATGREAEIRDIRNPEASYTAPLSS